MWAPGHVLTDLVTGEHEEERTFACDSRSVGHASKVNSVANDWKDMREKIPVVGEFTIRSDP